jgi:hypothetical protein
MKRRDGERPAADAAPSSTRFRRARPTPRMYGAAAAPGRAGDQAEPDGPRAGELDIREQEIHRKYSALSRVMDERLRRLWAGAEAEAYGEGGITAVQRATGLSRTTIRMGRDELRGTVDSAGIVQVRRPGAGRPRLEAKDSGLAAALEALIEPVARGDLESPMRWTCKSTRAIAQELTEQGRAISPQKAAQLLHSLGYSLQSPRRTARDAALSLSQRSARFQRVCDLVDGHLDRGTPVIAVTVRRVTPADPECSAPTLTLGVGDRILGQAIPSRVYDLSQDGRAPGPEIGLDPARFAVDAVRRWSRGPGANALAGATELLIALGADSPFAPHIFRAGLQRFADRTALAIGVCHLPPGTLRWCRIKHWLRVRVSQARGGEPRIDHEASVQLVGSTRTIRPRTGREAVPATDDEADWYYTVASRRARSSR